MPNDPRMKPSRLPEKYPDRDPAALARLIAEVSIGHIAFNDRVAPDAGPTVLPIAITYHGQSAAVADADALEAPFSILLHGSTGSRWLRLLAAGGPISLAVTAVDGLVVARSAFESSMHYRSAVLFGRCSIIEPGQKERALELITDSLIPGRTAELRAPRGKELAATLVLRMSVSDWTYKVSDQWPEDPDDDVAGPAWAGVLPRRTGFAAALDTFDLRPGIQPPASVRALLADPVAE
jgi:nitroimidazol reductase NimA-like FMN-containing flavoprotein (pyridoxamine 5'-phosphate oxidase superfamily)